MSWQTYSNWWIITKKELAQIQWKEKQLIKDTPKIKERPLACHLAGGLFAKYSLIVQKIDACLDQICQVQKRRTIRKLMDAATIRLNEMKEELTKIDMSEYHYIDGALIELKVIPHSVEILHPALFLPRSPEVQEMWERIKKGEKIFERPVEDEKKTEEEEVMNAAKLLTMMLAQREKRSSKAQHAPTEEEIEEEEEMERKAREDEEEQRKKDEKKNKKRKKKFVVEEKVLTPEEILALKQKEIISKTVLLIQQMEKARQARNYYNDYVRLKMGRRQAEAAARRKNAEAQDPSVKENATLTIQRYWRGFAVRQKMKRREQDRRLLIGMTEPSWRSTEEQDKMQKTIDARRLLRDQHIKEYIQANLDEKERILRVVGPGLMEDIGDEIREWFYQWYIRARNFDKYPPEEKGGTVLVVRGETLTPEEWLDEVERKRRARILAAGQDKDAKRKEAEKKKKEKAEKKKREAERKKKEKELAKKLARRGEGFAFEFKPSSAAQKMQAAFQEHKEMWDNARKDKDNPTETHYMDLITDEKCYEMQLELRKQVDELMRVELDLLNAALERDKLRLGKKVKPKKKPQKKRKKGKKGPKDITKNRKIEDLFQELVDNKVIRKYRENVRLADYIGDFSYGNSDRRMLEYDTPPTLGDVRQAVMLNCILPLGVEVMEKPKSVLIVGPRSSGIHLLADAVFNETQCVLFDLSPENIQGQYPGKDGLNMLIHLVNKMSRLLQPSIIFFDGGEKPFYKKVPKQEKEFEPKRFGGPLLKKIVKPIAKEDRVLVLGISRTPWAAKMPKLKKAYERIIMIPRSDYGSVFLYWRELLMSYHGIDRNLDVSAIAKCTENYPIPAIRSAAERVLTPRRIIQLKYRPLDLHELLEAIMDGPAVISDKEWKKYDKWFSKTNLGKAKTQYNAIMEKRREAAAKMAEKEEKRRKQQEKQEMMAAKRAAAKAAEEQAKANATKT